MEAIKVVISGLSNETKENGQPYGLMARAVVEHFLKDPRFKVLESALGGNEIRLDSFAPGILGPEARKLRFGNTEVGGQPFKIFPLECHELVLKELVRKEGYFIVVDFTHPTAVNMNADLYCRLGIPFVMGTTGGDREALISEAQRAGVHAVIAPNMAREIVGFTAMIEHAASNFPDLFAGYTLRVRESHQEGKADTSGTAKSIVGYFNHLGTDFLVDDIEKIRDPEIQREELGVPSEHLPGHGWHTYELTSPGKTVVFSFTHNVNGREVYALGTAEAVSFLAHKIQTREPPWVYSMIDVIKGC